MTKVPVVERLHEDDDYDLVIIPMRKKQVKAISGIGHARADGSSKIPLSWKGSGSDE